jgi:hypothetical protein
MMTLMAVPANFRQHYAQSVITRADAIQLQTFALL